VLATSQGVRLSLLGKTRFLAWKDSVMIGSRMIEDGTKVRIINNMLAAMQSCRIGEKRRVAVLDAYFRIDDDSVIATSVPKPQPASSPDERKDV
jgi:hypothetical protein